MPGWPMMPGVPAMGHVTAGGHWHSGGMDACSRCNPKVCTCGAREWDGCFCPNLTLREFLASPGERRR